MKKLLSIIMCVLLVCVALCACGRDDSVSDMASEAISSVATEASEIMSGDNGEVSDGDGFIGNETQSNTDETTDNTENGGNTSDTGTETGIM